MKRLLDILLSATALLCLFPVLIGVAIAIRVRMGAPVLFIQRRPGRGGQAFRMIKFRTMANTTNATGNPLPDKARITPLGRTLRAASIDELPELWNVLKGEMSLVGPRPLLMEYLPLYTAEQARRHEVRPGLTGWAQVNGRNSISWEEKFALDVWYIDNRSLWLDLKIIWMTLQNVLRRDGIDDAGGIGQERFKGSAN